MKARKKTISKRARRTRGRPLQYSMRLYIMGATERSTRAITNLRKLCDEYLPGQYDLDIVDVYQQPDLAQEAQIIAAPTLVKMLPLPLRRFIGDMSNKENLLAGLEIHSNSPATDDSE